MTDTPPAFRRVRDFATLMPALVAEVEYDGPGDGAPGTGAVLVPATAEQMAEILADPDYARDVMVRARIHALAIAEEARREGRRLTRLRVVVAEPELVERIRAGEAELEDDNA